MKRPAQRQALPTDHNLGCAKAPDMVNHPPHYTSHPSGVECITITEWFSFNLGNVIKYVWRAGLKSNDKLSDLKKAQFYLNREIARQEALTIPKAP